MTAITARIEELKKGCLKAMGEINCGEKRNSGRSQIIYCGECCARLEECHKTIDAMREMIQDLVFDSNDLAVYKKRLLAQLPQSHPSPEYQGEELVEAAASADGLGDTHTPSGGQDEQANLDALKSTSNKRDGSPALSSEQLRLIRVKVREAYLKKAGHVKVDWEVGESWDDAISITGAVMKHELDRLLIAYQQKNQYAADLERQLASAESRIKDLEAQKA